MFPSLLINGLFTRLAKVNYHTGDNSCCLTFASRGPHTLHSRVWTREWVWSVPAFLRQVNVEKDKEIARFAILSLCPRWLGTTPKYVVVYIFRKLVHVAEFVLHKHSLELNFRRRKLRRRASLLSISAKYRHSSWVLHFSAVNEEKRIHANASIKTSEWTKTSVLRAFAAIPPLHIGHPKFLY